MPFVRKLQIYGEDRLASNDNMMHVHIMLVNRGYKHTLGMCKIFLFFVIQQFFSKAPQYYFQSTAWFKKMDLISYVYISWIINGMWMIYITFEREGPKFSNTTARALAYGTAVQQRQLRAKWLLCSTRFFAFLSSLKLNRRLLCSLRFVFVSTFNLQRGRAFVFWITNLSK